MSNFDLKKYLVKNKLTSNSSLNENKSFNEIKVIPGDIFPNIDFIVQKLKSKYDVSIKDASDKIVGIEDKGIYLKTYYKNGEIKNWYTITKAGDDKYRFSQNGKQLRDWSLDDLFFNLLDNPNLSL